MDDVPCVQNLKRHDASELVYGTEADLQTSRMNLRLLGGKEGDRGRDG